MYRRYAIVVFVLAALYAGYWGAGAVALKRGVAAAVAQIEAEGRGTVGDVALRGFPSRFDLTLSDVALTDGGMGWQAPFVQLFALSYRPNHLIAVWPQDQSLTLGGQQISVRSDRMQANVDFGLSTTLPLDRIIHVTEAPRLSGPGWAAAAPRLAASVLREGGARYRLGLDLPGLVTEGTLATALDPEDRLPAAIDWLRLDAHVTLDRPIDRTSQPRPTALELSALSFRWGETNLEADGAITIDAAGVPDGRITLRARGWRDLIPLVVAQGMVKPEVAPTLIAALGKLEEASPTPGELSIPLDFSGGRMTLGPLPLGPAPRFF